MQPGTSASLATSSRTAPAQAGDAPAAQSPAATANNPAAPMPVDPLHSALGQVASALHQVDVSHWKVSRGWRRQLLDDSDSIQQDISSQLPGLFLKAQAAPKEIGPQLAVMQNVNALYDVLVRVSTAANLAGGHADAGALDDALQQLESSRKSASEQLLRAAALQDQHVVQLQAIIAQPPAGQTAGGGHPKTIVVDNDGRRRPKHRKPAPHKKPNSTPAQPAPNTPARN